MFLDRTTWDRTTWEVQTEIAPWQKILLDCADYIERYGWCQYVTEDRNGRVCTWGALLKVTEAPTATVPDTFSQKFYPSLAQRRQTSFDQAQEAVTRLLNGVCFIDWNDVPGRTQEEVVAMFRKAATKSC